MKNFISPIRFIVLGSLIGLGNAGLLHAATSPTSVTVKIIEARLSTNPDCTGGVTIFKSASPTTVDLVSNPTLGSGSIPNGTYHCLSVHLSDVITVTPQADDGATCRAGVPFTQDVFFDSSAQGHVSYAPDGSLINATGSPTAPLEDNPWIYFSDVNTASASNSCFLPPFGQCACANVGPCPFTALTVSGDQTHTLVINFDNKVSDMGNGRCELQVPTMTIQ